MGTYKIHPELALPVMIEKITTTDIDCVGTRRSTREGEPVLRSFFARAFYRLINKISDTEMVDGARDFPLDDSPNGRRRIRID